jgi:hypothetical protein
LDKATQEVGTVPRIERIAVAIALAAGVACHATDGSPRASVRPVERFPSFPAEAVARDVIVEARYYRRHAKVFGADLPRESEIVPIGLRIGLLPGSPAKVRFAPAEASMRLVLPDGTTLQLAAPEEIRTWNARGTQRAVAAAAAPRWLAGWTDANDEFVYFRLESSGELHLRGTEIAHKLGDVVRTMELDRSLIAFDVDYEGERMPIRVGVKVYDGNRR